MRCCSDADALDGDPDLVAVAQRDSSGGTTPVPVSSTAPAGWESSQNSASTSSSKLRLISATEVAPANSASPPRRISSSIAAARTPRGVARRARSSRTARARRRRSWPAAGRAGWRPRSRARTRRRRRGSRRSAPRRVEHERQLGLRDVPARVGADAQRRAGRRDAVRGGLEEQLGPLGLVDELVDVADRGLLDAGGGRAPVGHAARPHLLLVRDGRMFRLARERFPKMPLFPGHPTVRGRSPTARRRASARPATSRGGRRTTPASGYMSELVMGTTHTGAHIDAHAHMTVGRRGPLARRLGAHRPRRLRPADRRRDRDPAAVAARRALRRPRPPRRRGAARRRAGRRGRAAGDRGGDRRRGGRGRRRARAHAATSRDWPDPERLAAHRGAGPDISAARLLAERGVVATGSDTETYEVQPAPDRGSPPTRSRCTRCC